MTKVIVKRGKKQEKHIQDNKIIKKKHQKEVKESLQKKKIQKQNQESDKPEVKKVKKVKQDDSGVEKKESKNLIKKPKGSENIEEKKKEKESKREKGKKRKNDNPKKHLKNFEKKAKIDPEVETKVKKNQAHFTVKIDFLHNLKRDVTFDKMQSIQNSMRIGLFKAKRDEKGIFVVDNIDEELKTMSDKFHSHTVNIDELEEDEIILCLKRCHNILNLLYVFSNETEEFYQENANELSEMIKNKDNDAVVILDMAFSFISRKELILNCLAKYLVKTVSKTIKGSDFDHLLNLLRKPGILILDDEEEDDEFEPITEEDLAKLEVSKNNEDGDSDDEEDEEDEDDEYESDTDDEEENGETEVNENMVLALKKALGKAAMTGEDDEDIEINDEELVKIDKRLAAAFHEFTPKGRKMKQQMALKFRKLIAELGGIIVAECDIETLLKLLPKLFDLITEAEEKNRTDLYKALYEVCLGFQYRSKDEEIRKSEVEEYFKIICSLLELSFQIHNTNLESGIVNILRHMVIIAFKNKKLEKRVVEEYRQFFDKYFESKEKSSGFSIIKDAINRHHDKFIALLPKTFEYFEKSIKKNQTASLLNVFNRRDWRKQYKELYNKTADMIIKHYDLEIEENDQKAEKTFKQLTSKTRGLFKN